MSYRFSTALAAIMLTGAVLTTGGASAATINFEDITTSGGLGKQGTITGTEIPGVTITLGGANAGALGLYDSSCRPNSANPCTGGDEDLATGDGIIGIGANPKPTVNTPAEGFILISSAGSGATFGDKVGSPLFTFIFDVPTFINSFVLIDIDENPANVQATFNFTGGGMLSFDGTKATSVLNAGRNNAHSTFDIALIAGMAGFGGLLAPVDSFAIQFNNISGGIASLHTTPVPVPAALPLMLAGIGALAWAGRRRRAA